MSVSKIKQISIYHQNTWHTKDIGANAGNVDLINVNIFGTDPTPTTLSSFLNETFPNKISTGGLLYCSSANKAITASNLTPEGITSDLTRIEGKIDNYTPNNIIQGYYYNNNFYRDAEHNQQLAGVSGKIYIDLSTNKTYRYGSNSFVAISSGIDQSAVQSFTIRQINSGTISVNSNDNYAFNQTITIPSVQGYTPVSVAGYNFSDGEASLGKVCINNGNIEISGTILLNGSNSFTIDFNVLYIVTTSLIPQANNINY